MEIDKGLKLQVAIFDDVTSDNAAECNEFLEIIGNKVKDVNTHFNTILGGVVYVVIYFD